MPAWGLGHPIGLQGLQEGVRIVEDVASALPSPIQELHIAKGCELVGHLLEIGILWLVWQARDDILLDFVDGGLTTEVNEELPLDDAVAVELLEPRFFLSNIVLIFEPPSAS